MCVFFYTEHAVGSNQLEVGIGRQGIAGGTG
jgi:hypothetical protein